MIIAIDPSSKDSEVGWAIMDRNRVYFYGTGVRPAVRQIRETIVSNQGIDAIVVENQYFNPKLSETGAQSVLTLAHHAGRWLQVGDDYGIPVIFIAPLEWMVAVLGSCMKPGAAKTTYCNAAITTRYHSLISNIHVSDAICIGISFLERQHKGVTNVESVKSTKKPQAARKSARRPRTRKSDRAANRGKHQFLRVKGEGNNQAAPAG